jgi:hypothetical protein
MRWVGALAYGAVLAKIGITAVHLRSDRDEEPAPSLFAVHGQPTDVQRTLV